MTFMWVNARSGITAGLKGIIPVHLKELMTLSYVIEPLHALERSFKKVALVTTLLFSEHINSLAAAWYFADKDEKHPLSSGCSQ